MATWAIQYLTYFTYIVTTLLPLLVSRPDYSESVISAEQNRSLKRLTIKLPSPGRAVLVSKVEVRLRKASQDAVGMNVIETDLGDALRRKTDILAGRRFLDTS